MELKSLIYAKKKINPVKNGTVGNTTSTTVQMLNVKAPF